MAIEYIINLFIIDFIQRRRSETKTQLIHTSISALHTAVQIKIIRNGDHSIKHYSR